MEWCHLLCSYEHYMRSRIMLNASELRRVWETEPL